MNIIILNYNTLANHIVRPTGNYVNDIFLHKTTTHTTKLHKYTPTLSNKCALWPDGQLLPNSYNSLLGLGNSLMLL